ncbi:Ig-like domain-containing protein [uncultured Proteiniphilum sp.]|uniref:Ig-like domain-containing protein n=1 Tax=uncultured Proteiniphilum sp. TaxID=497637 RepID=UPI00260F8C6F|nr:Ig-like domain-containing protein [uncultured Proteiniphilum sp.]
MINYKYRVFLHIILFFFPTLISGGCGKSNIEEGYKLENIHLNKLSLTMQVGDTEQITAFSVPSVAHQPAFQWSSSDESVATVVNGLVEAIAVGEAVVTVKYQTVSVDIPITIEAAKPVQGSILYDIKINNTPIQELQLNGVAQYTTEGLNVTEEGNVVKLDKFYALAERMIRYHIKPSHNAKALFKSSEGDFNAFVDVPNKRISIATDPVSEQHVPFLEGNREYIVEIYHIYQQAKVRVIDIQTREEVVISVTNDGQGGFGAGALQKGFAVGMQWDHYCFGLVEGSSLLIKQITVYALKKSVNLLMYGDSITQPEGYFPTTDFPKAWTQMVISRLNGNAMSSGRGGGTITMVLNYIQNELPYIKAKYVMVTIGTNGGNTEANLTELINYIKEQGAIPILNNIPGNESGSQIENNELIEKVREKLGLKGCKFDMATSINGDGREVDKSLMYWEDYSNSYGWQIYHHPNEKGGQKMYERTLIDIPEIYE